MPNTASAQASFDTLGDVLKYLRRQARLETCRDQGEHYGRSFIALGGSAAVLDARRVPVTVPFRTQHPLGAVVNRPSVWSDR